MQTLAETMNVQTAAEICALDFYGAQVIVMKYEAPVLVRKAHEATLQFIPLRSQIRKQVHFFIAPSNPAAASRPLVCMRNSAQCAPVVVQHALCTTETGNVVYMTPDCTPAPVCAAIKLAGDAGITDCYFFAEPPCMSHSNVALGIRNYLTSGDPPLVRKFVIASECSDRAFVYRAAFRNAL